MKDINTGTESESSSPRGIATVSLGNLTFFRAFQGGTGYELWKTDGTESGTKMVRDIRPGIGSSLVDGVVSEVVGSRMVFIATQDDSHAPTMWATDGTYEGTVRLAEFQLVSSDFPFFGPVIGSTLYFTATTSAAGRELWRTDGTPAGTRLAVDLLPGATSSGMTILGQLGSQLLVSGTADGVTGGLYTTDGTPEGTRPAGVTASGIFGSISLGGVVLYARRTGGTGSSWDLMRTDGTAGGTTVVRGGFQLIIGFWGAGGRAYFLGKDEGNGLELWRSDGTLAGTSMAADLTPGPADSSIRVHATLGNRLLFATTGDAGKLWSTDGTPSGTRVVRDANRVYSGGVVSNGFFYFTMEDATYGFEPWKTDGTAEGTSLVADVFPGPADSIVVELLQSNVSLGTFVARPDGLFFAARNRLAGTEPWVTDGTAAGTRMVKNIVPDENYGSFPQFFTEVDGRLFFTAMSSSLWTSDGTEEGTTSLDVPGLRPEGGVSSGGLYYFINRVSQPELWRTDGSVAGTFRLAALGAGSLRALTPFKGGLFFPGNDPQHGTEPWFTDGTVEGTRMLRDLAFSTSDGGAGRGVLAGPDTLLFGANSTNVPEIWLTDGTPDGTRRLARSEPFVWAAWPDEHVWFGGAFFGLGTRYDETTALWRIDAATGEFTAVRRLDAREETKGLWHVGGALLFVVGNDLWQSDGTQAGTVPVLKDLKGCFSSPVVGDGVLYWYSNANSVAELWRSDGTAAGTFRLVTRPGDSICEPQSLYYSEGRLYFPGWDVVHGHEPWVTDGTLLGTRRLWDVNPGPASSEPASFLRIGRTLFFSAEEPGAGRELWAMETGCDGGDCPPRRRRVRR